jgi:hypothetical protein
MLEGLDEPFCRDLLCAVVFSQRGACSYRADRFDEHPVRFLLLPLPRAIEQLYPDKLDERAALLAHHWEGAGDTATAAVWHGRAARPLVPAIYLRAAGSPFSQGAWTGITPKWAEDRDRLTPPESSNYWK